MNKLEVTYEEEKSSDHILTTIVSKCHWNQ